MRAIFMTAATLVILAAGFAAAQTGGKAKVPPVLSFTVENIAGQPVNLSKYAGKAVLVVNVASECGFTPQYAGLQALHRKYSAKGLTILGFPSNDFGEQEPGTNADIQQFCKSNYGVEFDMFAKVRIVGNNKAPLYEYLTSRDTNPKFSGDVGWNFEKFLIGRDGEIVARFLSDVEPQSEEMLSAIESALARK